MPNKFTKAFNKAEKIFKSYNKEFNKMLDSDSELSVYSQTLSQKFSEKILTFFDNFIYFYFLEKKKDSTLDSLNKEEYFRFLKGLILFVLTTQNSFSKNIFKKDFIGSHNPKELNLSADIDDESRKMISDSYNIIYTLSLILNKLFNSEESIDLIYDIVFNYLAFVITNSNSVPLTKRSLFKKTIPSNLDESINRIEIVLEYFKQCQDALKNFLPQSFNDLTYYINKTFKKMD